MTKQSYSKDWMFLCSLDIMPNWGFLLNILNLNVGTHMFSHVYGRNNVTTIVGEVCLSKQPYILKTGPEIKKDRLIPAERSPVQVETERRWEARERRVEKQNVSYRKRICYRMRPNCFIFWGAGLAILPRKRKWESAWGRRVWMRKVRSVHLFIRYLNLFHWWY